MKTLCLDPSGNWLDGKGKTGWALFRDGKLEEFEAIDSEDFDSQEMYWQAHWNLVEEFLPDEVVCESYRLQGGKALQQSGSWLETPQLIGFLKMMCWQRDIPFYFQSPSDKVRVADPILVKLGVFELRGKKHYCMGRSTNDHIRDAIRHGIFYHRFGKGKAYANRPAQGAQN